MALSGAILGECRTYFFLAFANVLLSYFVVLTAGQWFDIPRNEVFSWFAFAVLLSVIAAITSTFFCAKSLWFIPSPFAVLAWFFVASQLGVDATNSGIGTVFAISLILCVTVLMPAYKTVAAVVHKMGVLMSVVVFMTLLSLLWSWIPQLEILDITAWSLLAVLAVVLVSVWWPVLSVLVVVALFVVCGVNLVLDADVVRRGFSSLLVWRGGESLSTALLRADSVFICVLFVPACVVLCFDVALRITLCLGRVSASLPGLMLFWASVCALASVLMLPVTLSPFSLYGSHPQTASRASNGFSVVLTSVVTIVCFLLLNHFRPSLDQVFPALLVLVLWVVVVLLIQVLKGVGKKTFGLLAVALGLAVFISMAISLTGWLPEPLEFVVEYLPFSFLIIYIWLRFGLSIR